MKKAFLALALVFLAGSWQIAAGQSNNARDGAMSSASVQRITREAHHELALLPYYGVFDFLAYKVSPDGTLTLLGQVTRPVLKSDAEAAVKHIEGVEHVDNQIQVLPPSPDDDQIRRSAFRAIYGSPQLSKYSWQAVQSIHIIVNGGHITLEGVVDNQSDKQVAEIQAKSVPNAFSVENHLIVAESK